MMKTMENPSNQQNSNQQNFIGIGHRKRLKERFLKNGLQGFHDYEVIELLLSLNTPRKDCKQSAKTLLKRFAYDHE